MKQSPRIIHWIYHGQDHVITIGLGDIAWQYRAKDCYPIHQAIRMHDLGYFRFKDWNVIKKYGKMINKWNLLNTK